MGAFASISLPMRKLFSAIKSGIVSRMGFDV
jgi:hypothetical protein